MRVSGAQEGVMDLLEINWICAGLRRTTSQHSRAGHNEPRGNRQPFPNYTQLMAYIPCNGS